ncbi:DUF2304 family protein [Pseudomonas sp. NPDC086278]|uniref:DUF2304 family protein n=1 Tax=Pseudomonas sp. NPDC086278 TaxID=3390646 RepID=UPI003D011DD8
MIFNIFLAAVFLFMAVYIFVFIKHPFIRAFLCSAYLAAIYFVWDPEITTTIAHYFGIGRGLDFFLILLSVTIVNALVLVLRHLHVQQRQLTNLARKFALHNVKVRTHQE